MDIIKYVNEQLIGSNDFPSFKAGDNINLDDLGAALVPNMNEPSESAHFAK